MPPCNLVSKLKKMSSKTTHTFGGKDSGPRSTNNVKKRMKNLSSALGELKTNLESTDRHNQTGTPNKFLSSTSEVRDLREEIFSLKLAFKNMVDLMLEEIDELKNDITYQSAELKSQADSTTASILGRIEVLQVLQDQKDSKCDDQISQAEYLSSQLTKKFST